MFCVVSTLKELLEYESPVPAVVVAPEYTSPLPSTPSPPAESEERVRVPGEVMFPAESIDVVAVPPKYAVPKTDASVVDALAKLWRAVHAFACARLRSAVMVPLVVTGVEPMVRVEFEEETPTEVTEPPMPAPATQTPLTERHPFEISMPLAKVDVAVAEVTLRALACSPPAKVEVAVVDVAVM